MHVNGQPTNVLSTLADAHKIANSNPDSAVVMYNYVLHNANEDLLTYVKALNGKGNALQFMSQYDSSLAVFLRALKISEAERFDHESASIKNNIGSFYMTLSNMAEARNYLEEALNEFMDLSDTIWITRVIINLAGVDYMTGNSEASLMKLKQAAELSKHTGNTQSEGGTYTNISIVYRSLGNIDSALYYVDKGIDLLVQLNDQRAQVLSLKEKGNILHEFGRVSQARETYLEMNEIARSMDYTFGIHDSYKLLAALEEEQNNLKEALSYMNKAEVWKDSLLNEKTIETINEMSAKYESERKDTEIALLSKENELRESERNTYIATSVGILGIAILLMVLFIQKQKVNDVLETKNKTIMASLEEREVLLKEIHHRVKNNLQIVSSLLNVQSRFLNDVESKKAIQESRNRVQSMALVHQKLYQNEDLARIAIPDYLTQLSQTLFESYRIDGARVTLSTNIDDVDLDLDTTIYLGLMVNELISNALKHAFPEDREGRIAISLKKLQDEIQLTVSDDGIGSALSSNGKSYGQRLIRTLSSGLNASVETLHNPGTTVCVKFNVT